MKPLSKRALILAAFIIGMMLPLAAQTTQVVVAMHDGTQQSFYLSEEDRMYFEDNAKLVIEEGFTKSTVKIPLADIRKMTCHEMDGTLENSDTEVSIFPNPTQNTLTIRNTSDKQTVSIYALDGRLMKSLEVSGDLTIDIADWAAGLYFVKTQSSTLKMVKL